jgi:hypothetical protein
VLRVLGLQLVEGNPVAELVFEAARVPGDSLHQGVRHDLVLESVLGFSVGQAALDFRLDVGVLRIGP